ncbi:uncharacterized protein METZ01_LOCUS219200, partial [marine metagenome]
MSGTVHWAPERSCCKAGWTRRSPDRPACGRGPGLRVTRSNDPLWGAVHDLSHRHELPVIRAVVLEARQAEGVTEV